MDAIKTKTLHRIEGQMEKLDEGSIRYRVLTSAKNFKTSWIELGQALYSVWKDRLYKEWGYMTFDAYTSKEIGIKKPTALKLLKSYYFLEKEEPYFLQKDRAESQGTASLPNYESVNVLRLARNKKTLDESDYSRLKRDVLEMGKDASEIKKDLTSLIRAREELEPEEARRRKRLASVKRFVATLKALKRDVEMSKMLSAGITKEISALINRIESELD